MSVAQKWISPLEVCLEKGHVFKIAQAYYVGFIARSLATLLQKASHQSENWFWWCCLWMMDTFTPIKTFHLVPLITFHLISLWLFVSYRVWVTAIPVTLEFHWVTHSAMATRPAAALTDRRPTNTLHWTDMNQDSNKLVSIHAVFWSDETFLMYLTGETLTRPQKNCRHLFLAELCSL